jgi:hypothetical protein
MNEALGRFRRVLRRKELKENLKLLTDYLRGHDQNASENMKSKDSLSYPGF